MSEKILQQILNELSVVKNQISDIKVGYQNMTESFDGLEVHYQNMNHRFDGLENEYQKLNNKFDKLDSQQESLQSELREFREETRINFQVVNSGNQGLRKQVNQRFKETKDTLAQQEDHILEEINDLKFDIELTYAKTSKNELAIKKMRAKE